MEDLMIRRVLTVIVLGGALALSPWAWAVTQGAAGQPPAGPGASQPHPPSPHPPHGHAAPACFDNVNRYVDCGNGTVTDTVTGLIWLRDASCLGQADWATANTIATHLKHGTCGLSDGSRAGDWRLATATEWAATVLHAFQLNCRGAAGFPSLTDNGGTGCFAGTPEGTGPTDHAFAGVPAGPGLCDALDDQACIFWTSTTSEAFGTLAVRARLFFGTANDAILKTQVYGVWPVRTRP
jgi:hypothetical protein